MLRHSPIVTILGLSIALPAVAQIVPTPGSTDTQIDITGDRLDISGGQTSSDGANLFHDFAQFDLSAEQLATFLVTGDVQNVLGRIGGSVSTIDGAIAITGSDANLFLMNPAGIVFGENARLNVAGDFTATTAAGIGFGSGWLEAAGAADWAELTGDPVAFDFAGAAGAIVNRGELRVGDDANLNLFGGATVNDGALAGGNVSLTAVSGGALRLSSAGNVLSLEIDRERAIDAGSATLPELLAGGEAESANTLQFIDGVAQLGLDDVSELAAGDSIVTGTIDVSGETGGIAQVLGDRVGLVGGAIDASGQQGGGEIYVGGEYLGGGTLPTATFATIDANSSLDVSAIVSGDGGTAIVWSDDTTRFFGNISATGGTTGGDGGFVETSGAAQLFATGFVDTGAAFGLGGTWLLDPNDITIVSGSSDVNINQSGTQFDTTDDGAIVTTESIEMALSAGDVVIMTQSAGANTQNGDIFVNGTISPPSSSGGSLTLSADRNITVSAPISLGAGGSLFLFADAGGVDIAANLLTQDGDIELATGSASPGFSGVGEGIRIGAQIETGGGNISLNGSAGSTAGGVGIELESGALLRTIDGGSITLTGSANNDRNAISINSGAQLLTASGNITLQSTTDQPIVSDGTLQASGGNITFSTNNNITFGTLISGGGNITLISSSGVNNGSLDSDGGNIVVTANGGFSSDEIDSSNSSGDGGEVKITTTNSDISLSGGIDARGSTGGGPITLTAGSGQRVFVLGTVSGTPDSIVTSDGANITISQNGDTATANTSFNFEIGANTDDLSANNVGGTEGSISNGTTTIETGTIVGGAVSGVYTEGGITIGPGELLAGGSPPASMPDPAPAPAPSPSPSPSPSPDSSDDNQSDGQGDGQNNGQGDGQGDNQNDGQDDGQDDGHVDNHNDGQGDDDRGDDNQNDGQNNANQNNTPSPSPSPEPSPSPSPSPSPAPSPEPSPSPSPTPSPSPAPSAEPAPTPAEDPPSEVANDSSRSPETTGTNQAEAGGDRTDVNQNGQNDEHHDHHDDDRNDGGGDGDNDDRNNNGIGRAANLAVLSVSQSPTEVARLDNDFSAEYSEYFAGGVTPLDAPKTQISDMREAMGRVSREFNLQTGLAYVHLQPEAIEISILTADGVPIRHIQPIDRDEFLKTLADFRNHLVNLRLRRLERHQEYGAQLYDWIMRPIEAELEARGIDTLMFAMDAGLRSLPLAALYNGEEYLVEKYSLSLIPSLGLVDTNYRSVVGQPVQAMGASEFQTLPALPAVPAELATLDRIWGGDVFLNEDFTRTKIVRSRDRNAYPIVHLATHGEFTSGSVSSSYLQLWDERISLDRIRNLGWNSPPVDLLVLSACRTALGDEQAELGFAGLAVAAGVKTAIASLWYVDDTATFMLMTALYDYLATAPIKAEALRSAQRAMIDGTVRVEDGMLIVEGIDEPIPLPESLHRLSGRDFSHPYYWSAFTAIGSPW